MAGMTQEEKNLATQCANYVMGDEHMDALMISLLGICATEDVKDVAVLLQTYASSVLYTYIKSHQTSEDLTDQLFGKAIKGK